MSSSYVERRSHHLRLSGSIAARPDREWRPIVDRCLGGFNVFVLLPLLASSVLMTLGGLFGAAIRGPLLYFVLPPGFDLFSVPAVLAAFGFLGHQRRRLRAWLTVPSGVLCVLTGAMAAWDARGPDLHWCSPPAQLMMAAFLFMVGALTIESAVARMRPPPP
jgi:hypothetical protein